MKPPLAGNSIGSLDRPFILKHMSTLNDNLHHRNLDATSFAIALNNFYPEVEPFKKSRNHLAMDDIVESINEMKYYMDAMGIKPENPKKKTKTKQKPQ